MWYKELKELRIETGMLGKELAEKVGKSATYISRIENGEILNTSFELISSIAKVIAETDGVKSGKIDLNNYHSDFAKLVLSYRYESMKDVYDYVKENREVEKYSNIMRHLSKGDIDLFETVARYRMSEGKFNDAKKILEEKILKDTKMKKIKDVVKEYGKQGYELTLPIKVQIEDIIEGSYKDFMDILSNEINSAIEDIDVVGLDRLLNMREYAQLLDSDEEGEIILEAPVIE